MGLAMLIVAAVADPYRDGSDNSKKRRRRESVVMGGFAGSRLGA
jgi:hypothetical protein